MAEKSEEINELLETIIANQHTLQSIDKTAGTRISKDCRCQAEENSKILKKYKRYRAVRRLKGE